MPCISGPVPDDDWPVSDLGVNELHRSECLALLATTNLGQLALTRRALPAVIPANYVVYRDRILIHASPGFDAVPWNDGEIVALHVSVFDADQRVGWSVSVTGVAHGTPDLAGIENIPHAPWIPHGGGHLIAISTDLVHGEHLGPTPEPTIPDREAVSPGP